MSRLLQSLRDTLWPVRSSDNGAKAADGVLRFVAIILIALLAGPDLLVAVDMTTLLELLGATLFFLTFAAGTRLLMASLEQRIRAVGRSLSYLLLVRAQSPSVAPVALVAMVCLVGGVRKLMRLLT